MNLLILSSILLAPPTPTTESKSFTAAQQWAAIQATVRITSANRDFTTCTGVVIAVRDGAAYVLTAAHGAKSVDEYKMEFFNKEKYPLPAKVATSTQIGVVMESVNEDISLIKVAVGKEELPGVMKLALLGARTKAFPIEMLTIGCSDGTAPTALVTQITGKKLRKRTELDLAFFWETNTAPVSGRSGGPLMDKDGKLIGICSARTLDQTQRGYYCHLDEIHAALKRNGQEWLVERK